MRDMAVWDYKSTLAHELGHARYNDRKTGHDNFDQRQEERADRFAAKLLINDDELKLLAPWRSTDFHSLAIDLEVTPTHPRDLPQATPPHTEGTSSMKLRRALTAALAVPVLALGACAVEVSDSTSSEDNHITSSQPAPTVKMGEKAESDGLELVVQSFTKSPSIELYAEGVKRGSSPDETVEARAGGKFVIVSTEVTNETTQAIDLTCGFDAQAELGDADERHYEPIDNLYRVKNTPDCNEYLNPGFSTPMTWVFEVPEDTDPKYLYFANPETRYDDFIVIELDKPGAIADQEGAEPSPSLEQQATLQGEAPEEAFTQPGNGYQCPGTDAYVNSPSDCTSQDLGGDPAYDDMDPGGYPKQPSPWVQGQIDWAACLDSGHTEQECRDQLN